MLVGMRGEKDMKGYEKYVLMGKNCYNVWSDICISGDRKKVEDEFRHYSGVFSNSNDKYGWKEFNLVKRLVINVMIEKRVVSNKKRRKT